jgi:hypothetical protein
MSSNFNSLHRFPLVLSLVRAVPRSMNAPLLCRTAPIPRPYEALIPSEKFKIASEDAFDGGTVALAMLFAGEAQLTNSTPHSVKATLNTSALPMVWRCGDWGHDDGSHLSCYASSRRFWEHSVQLFRDRRQLNCKWRFRLRTITELPATPSPDSVFNLEWTWRRTS